MIRLPCLLLLLCLASSCESPPPAPPPPPPPRYETAPIDGTWSALAGDLAGQEFSEDQRKSIRLIIHEGRYEVSEAGHFDQAIVAIDPMLKPATMDITWMTGPNKGKRILAIYETTGDTLRICYDLSGAFRPGAFVTARGTQLLLMLFARER